MVIPEQAKDLPIGQVLEELSNALAQRDEVVLQAPPGAGKTTLVPLALLDEPWLEGQKILVLEPRRLAARAAAQRMADLLGETLGQTVGYRIRLDTCVGPNTRIEIITEGILIRQLQQDPGLAGVGLVIFDEFHERNLDSDLGLALALHGREIFREQPSLKLLVMSATLDGAAVAQLLNKAPVITSQGRQYPVAVSYGDSYHRRQRIAPLAVTAILRALKEQAGSVLVFLPGQGEINQVARELKAPLAATYGESVCLTSLFGGLSLAQQQRAIEAAPTGSRKVVLATNIAETSLTIEGISVVVDSGLAREPVFDPATGMTRLDTRRISRASAEQRKGRAGRLTAGHCYRLWSEEQQGQLLAHGSAEILQADLASLALQLLAWGVDDPAELHWLTAPPQGPFQQAVASLQACGALAPNTVGGHQLSPHGERLARLPLHPRLGHMLLVAASMEQLETGSLLAALFPERNPLAASVDIAETMAVLRGELKCPAQHKGWLNRTRQQAKRYASTVKHFALDDEGGETVPRHDVLGLLVASAYPDRIAKGLAGGVEFQMGNGRRAVLPETDALAAVPWLAVAEMGGRVGDSADRIYSATELNSVYFDSVLGDQVRQLEVVEWDTRRNTFVAERRWMIGKHIVLRTEPLTEVPAAAREEALLALVRRRGLAMLPWSEPLQQWRARVNLLHQVLGGEWPDLSDQALLDSLEDWLAPWLASVRRLVDFKSLDLTAMLATQLPWPLPRELERLAPEKLQVPSGSRITIDYSQQPPVLAVKLQEMFGCETTPAIAGGAVPLLVHLLSPARRPLQITQDLAGFWRSSYQDVKKDMKGRYPKHPWPDDPTQAVATRYTKKRQDKE